MARKRKKRRSSMLTLLYLLFIGLIIINIYYFINPLFFKSTEVEVGLNKEYDPIENVQMVFLNSVDNVKVTDKIDTSKPGVVSFNYEYKGRKFKSSVTVIDDVAPVLTLQDYATDMVEDVNPKKFVKECVDDSDVTYTITSKNIGKSGENKVVVKATDSYGNSTSETTTLIRTKDTTAPSIEDIAPRINVLIGDSFDYVEALGVQDDMDSNPKVTTSTEIDFDKAGVYDVEYTISDRSGNKVTANQTIEVIDATEENAKVIYLTFDDGPSERNTARVLDTLKKYNAKATFFVIGLVNTYPEMVQREYDEGHRVALHSYTHDYAIYSSTATYFDDLESIQAAVEEITGEKSQVIRFPGGSSNTISANYSTGIMSTLVNMVEEKGYEYYDWDVSSGDASYNGVPASEIVANVTGHSADQMTVLFHDTDMKDTSVEALPEIIEYYYNEGYVFLPLTKGVSYASHQGTAN